MSVRDYIDYEVSNLGRVRSLKFGKVKILNGGKTKEGYCQVHLSKNGKQKKFLVHRLVWEAFNGPIPDGYEIDHRDANKQNNILDNLRCVTHIENMRNPVTRPIYLEGIKKRSENKEWQRKHSEAMRKVHNKPVHQIDKVTGKIIKTWKNARDIQRETGIHYSAVSACCYGKYGFKSAGGYRWQFA